MFLSKIKNLKSLLIISFIVFFTILLIDTTNAYLIDSTKPVENIFNGSKISCEIEETIKDQVKQDVQIKNTSDIDAFIRAKVIITWKDQSGNIYRSIPQKDVDYTIEYDQNQNWKYHSDGFWYYKSIVEPNQNTKNLIENCTLISTTIPSGYSLSVEILGEAIQTNAASDAWGFDPSTQ